MFELFCFVLLCFFASTKVRGNLKKKILRPITCGDLQSNYVGPLASRFEFQSEKKTFVEASDYLADDDVP